MHTFIFIQWHAKVLNTLQIIEFLNFVCWMTVKLDQNTQILQGFSPIIGYWIKNIIFLLIRKYLKSPYAKVLDTFNFSLISLSYHYDIAFKLLWLCFMMECNCSAKQNWPHNFVNSGFKIKFSVLWPTGCLPWPTGKTLQWCRGGLNMLWILLSKGGVV